MKKWIRMIILKVQHLLAKGYELLKEENVESYILDCQLLLGKVLNLDRMSIILNRDMEVSEVHSEEYFKLVKQRKNSVPVKYLTGSAEFMGINFYITEGVLIPRPDTEILVEEAIKEIEKQRLVSVCDLCCGSGAIGLSIAKILDFTRVDLCDISETAELVTMENIERLHLSSRTRFIKSDLLSFAIRDNSRYDIIVSNPPYIRTEVIPTLMDDVKNHEPYIALWGGEDGLDFYRRITEQSRFVLRSGGTLAYEIGHDQANDVYNILLSNDFEGIRCIKDLAGLDRVIIGTKK